MLGIVRRTLSSLRKKFAPQIGKPMIFSRLRRALEKRRAVE
jgi:hypothetical protein